MIRQAVLVAVLVALFLPGQAHAMRFWRFSITVDGAPMLTGGIGMNDQTPPKEVLQTGLLQAGIQLGTDSRLDQTTTGDLTLTGDVVLKFPELPDYRTDRLQLVYAPEQHQNKYTVAGGYYDWHLHPDDVAAILRFHGISEPGLSQRIGNVSAPADVQTGILMSSRFWLVSALVTALMGLSSVAALVYLLRMKPVSTPRQQSS